MRLSASEPPAEMINEATANGLEKGEIQDHVCNAWKYIINEECLGLDGNGLFGVRDTNKEEEDLDLTGGKWDGAAGSSDTLLDNIDSTAIDTEENLQRQLKLAAKHLQMPLFNKLQRRLNELRAKKGK